MTVDTLTGSDDIHLSGWKADRSDVFHGRSKDGNLFRILAFGSDGLRSGGDSSVRAERTFDPSEWIRARVQNRLLCPDRAFFDYRFPSTDFSDQSSLPALRHGERVVHLSCIAIVDECFNI